MILISGNPETSSQSFCCRNTQSHREWHPGTPSHLHWLFLFFWHPVVLSRDNAINSAYAWICFVQVIDKSFGFDTSIEEAQRAINAAHVEAESAENGIGVVKLMGRQSGECQLFNWLNGKDSPNKVPFYFLLSYAKWNLVQSLLYISYC